MTYDPILPFALTKPMQWQQHITVDPTVVHGAACFNGTRIPVSVVLDNLAAGVSEVELRRNYPTLPANAVTIALAYAADLTRERIVFIPA